MIKMVVSSFYNTLINKEEAIPTSTMLEIERIRNKGYIFVLVTNRLVKEVLDYNRDFPFIDYIISLNGSYLYDVNKSKCLFKKKMLKKDINYINKLFKDNKKYYYTEDNYYLEYNNKGVYKIEVEIAKKDIKKYQDLDCTIFINNSKVYLEFTNTNINEYVALDKLINKKASKEEILVIAGNDSNRSLIDNISNNYVVENASSELLKRGHKKTNSNNELGVEKVLKTL